jgi:hypothetical protein
VHRKIYECKWGHDIWHWLNFYWYLNISIHSITSIYPSHSVKQDSSNLAWYIYLLVIYPFFLWSGWGIEYYQSVWQQTHYDVTNKNNYVSIVGLNVHYH